MKFDKEFLTNWHVFKNKMPVRYPTSQRAAHRAYDRLREHFTPEERTQIIIAWSHATMVGEGRREFDFICKKIERRLGISA